MRKILHIAHSPATVSGRFQLPASTTVWLLEQPEEQLPRTVARHTFNGGHPKVVSEAISGFLAFMKKAGFTSAAERSKAREKKPGAPFCFTLVSEGNEVTFLLACGLSSRVPLSRSLEQFDREEREVPAADRSFCAHTAQGLPDAVATLKARLEAGPNLTQDAEPAPTQTDAEA